MRYIPRFTSSAVATFDLFLAVGVLGVYLKAALLGREWDAVARFLGKNGAVDLTVFEKLGFFWQDFALNLVLMPIAATAIVCVLFTRHRVKVALAVSIALIAAYFVELRAHAAVGQFISGDVVDDLIGWSIRNPEMARDYASVESIVKLALLFVSMIGIVLVDRRSERAARGGRVAAARVYAVLLRVPAIAALLLGVALALTGLACRLPNAQLNESAVSLALGALTAAADEAHDTFATFGDALAASRRDTRTAPLDPHHPFIGRERGSNLLMCIMETGPSQALDLSQVGRTLPGSGPLFERSFVAAQHYTTHPYSSDALYSILSGLYPQGRRRLLRAIPDRLNGLMTALDDVPVRRVYLPSLYNLKLDDRMYELFGAESVYVSDAQASDPLRLVAERRTDALLTELQTPDRPLPRETVERLRRRLRGDLQALERAKADIVAAVRAGQRYAIIFFPEIGHGPWVALHAEDSVVARGRALMVLQDGWLKELTDTIRDAGRLDRTVIAVTADHGIRTRAEDPSVPIGRISDYMFRVPLLVYAPNTLTAAMPITVPTSHIDLAPTLAALFGKADSAAAMQGVPLWQRTAHDRLYFLAAPYGGADGFVEDGRYCMRQALSGAVYCNQSLSFADRHQVPPGATDVARVARTLDDATRLQQAVVTRILHDARP
ncbi:MAG TPA: sulfatase-like hydrolase/transferase [Vicinamibacterales bacterium]|nr:sulfatase-like hydrolase/transferase [Vicinamibacterales bacterium]